MLGEAVTSESGLGGDVAVVDLFVLCCSHSLLGVFMSEFGCVLSVFQSEIVDFIDNPISRSITPIYVIGCKSI